MNSIIPVRFLLIPILLLLSLSKGLAQQPGKAVSFGGGDLQIGIYGGRSTLLEKAPAILGTSFEDFFDHFKRGWSLSADAGYWFNRYVGAGINYSNFHSERQASDLDFQVLIFTVNFDVASKMAIHTLAPAVNFRVPLLSNRLLLGAGAGPSWMIYRSSGSIDAESEAFNGSLPGLTGLLSAAFMLTPKLGVELKGNYQHAFIPATDTGTSPEDQLLALVADNYRKISRIDGTAGIFYRINLKR